MTDYKPGTVAMVTTRRRDATQPPRTRLAFYDGYDCRWVSAHSGGISNDEAAFEHDVRPLVVLDLKDHSPAVLADQLAREGFHDIADQIEEQTKPPRIPEPGLWAVVEATREGLPRRRWVHHEEGRWVCDTAIFAYWDSLSDPELIREGVE